MDPLETYGRLMGKLPDPPATKQPPSQTFDYWVKKISHELFVNNVTLGEFVEMFQKAWTDAYAKGVRDAANSG